MYAYCVDSRVDTNELSHVKQTVKTQTLQLSLEIVMLHGAIFKVIN